MHAAHVAGVVAVTAKPGSHDSVHVAGIVLLPGATSMVPAGQAPDVHIMFCIFVYEPGAHGVHMRSDVGVGIALTPEPGSHVVNGLHAMALAVLLKPMVQAAHLRSVVAVPAAVTNVPAGQSLHAAHAGAFAVVV